MVFSTVTERVVVSKITIHTQNVYILKTYFTFLYSKDFYWLLKHGDDMIYKPVTNECLRSLDHLKKITREGITKNKM